MTRQQFAARVWAKLIAHEREQRLLSPGDSVLAAVSGGPDSVCLAHFLAQLARRKRFSLAFLYIDHGLRRQAAAEARFVQSLGRALSVPVLLRRAAVRAAARRRGAGLEEAARKLRYRAIAATARARGFNKAAVGHQLDDQAETVLLNLLRGTRLSGLGAMAPARPLAQGVTLIRPLLALSRLEIEAYLERHGLDSRLDRSNLSERFTRNWLRRTILPAIARRQPRVREHLSALAAQVRGLTTTDIG